MLSKLLRRKPIAERTEDALDTDLKRTLGKWQLTALGVGAIIGAGIFSAAGTAIAGGSEHVGAGPALIVSYIGVAIACGFAALCYAEFAAMIPESGSAYTYAYSTLGEMVAWIIG
ncbi:MAG TPA: amino acid permease, partial [Gemmatimonadota bacterium]|nr:amino acid permease [Gemmatimonadota bacterium]